jgi:branched-chain amino acid transport system substrate-binding protein
METLANNDPIADGDVKYGPNDHQGGDVIVISKIEGGVWKEIGRVDPTKSQ